MQETINVANVKCQGCARTIRESLLKINGVADVDVGVENGSVTVRGEGLDRKILTTTLADIGYPEATDS